MSTPLVTDYCEIDRMVTRCLLRGDGLTVETDMGEVDYYGDDLRRAWKDLAPGEAFLPVAVLSAPEDHAQAHGGCDLVGRVEDHHRPALRAFAHLLTAVANNPDCWPWMLVHSVTLRETYGPLGGSKPTKDVYKLLQQTIYCEAMQRCVSRWPGYTWNDDDLAYMIAEVAREVPAEA